MDRRRLLTAGAACLASLLARPARAGPAEAPPAAATDDLGADFEGLDRSRVQMAGFLLSSHPRPVAAAIARHRAGLDADPAGYHRANAWPGEREARRAAAEHLGVDWADVALVDSTTMGLGLVYGGIDLRAGQELLTTTHDHYVTHEALRLRSRATGATLRKIRLYDELDAVTAEDVASRVARELRPETRVLAITWVHSSTGLRVPVRRIADVVAEVNRGRSAADRVLLCVDGVHGLGVEDARLPDLGCDVFVAGAHKWLCGPRGTGIVWAGPRGREAVRPIVPTFSGQASWGGRMTPGGYHAFDHRWALDDAFRWHLERRDAITRHHWILAARLKDGLAGIPGVRLATPRSEELSSGLVCFDVGTLPAEEVDRRLLDAGVITRHAPYERSYVRFAPAIYTTPAEVDRALEAVEAVASRARRGGAPLTPRRYTSAHAVPQTALGGRGTGLLSKRGTSSIL